jgi:hypothetical protein
MTHTLDRGDDIEFKQYPGGNPAEATGVLDTPGGPYRDEDGNLVADVELLAAVTGVVDDVGDVIVPNAFRRTLAEMKAKGVSAHDWKTPYAKAIVREEWQPGDPRLPKTVPVTGEPWPASAGALYVKAQYNLETEAGRTAYANAKFYKDEQNFSIGYKVRQARKRGGVRYITDLDWYEWSDVLHGANKYAHLLSVKSGDRDGMEYTGIRPEQTETKARYVRDQEFWGLPYGTPIRLGMKPMGPKAHALRSEGKPVTQDMGVTHEKPSAQAVVDAAKAVGGPTPDVHGLASRIVGMQPSTAKATLRGYSDDELNQLDRELANRATDGQVSAPHQLVKDAIAERSAGGAPNAPSAPDKPLQTLSPQMQHALMVAKPAAQNGAAGTPDASLRTTPHPTVSGGLVDRGLATPHSDGGVILTPEGERHRQALLDKHRAGTPNPTENVNSTENILRRAGMTTQQRWQDNPEREMAELPHSQRMQVRNSRKRNQYIQHRQAGLDHPTAMRELNKPAPTGKKPTPAKAAPKVPEAPNAPEVATGKPAPGHRSRVITPEATRQRTHSNRGRGDWLKSASNDELAQEAANIHRNRSQLGNSVVSDGRNHAKHEQHLKAVEAEQKRRGKGGAPAPKVDHALMADRINNDTMMAKGPGGKAGHAASLAGTALLRDEDPATRSMTENVASALASGRDPGEMPANVKPEDVKANLAEMADHIEHSGADLGDNGAYVQKLRDWTPGGGAPQAGGDDNGGEPYKPTGNMNNVGALSDAQLQAEHTAAHQKLRDVSAAGETRNSAAYHDAKMARDVFGTEINRRRQERAANGDQQAADALGAQANRPVGAGASQEPGQPDVNAGPSPEEQISPEQLDQMQNVADAAMGLSEDPEGQLEVTTDVADRQDRVSELLQQADAGTLDLTGMENDQLGATRQDVVDELKLQNEIHRRDAVAANASPITGTVTPPTGAPAAPSAPNEPGGAATHEVAKVPPAGEPNAPAAPEAPQAPAVPATPKPKAGLAGAAEDYAEAIDAGDENRAAAARARLESSLRRSKTDSEHAQGLRDLLTEVDSSHPDAEKVRELAGNLRSDTRDKRNASARDRRAAKRLERDKLRSLLGQIDAEMRSRNLDPVTYGGPAPTDQPGVPTPGEPGMPNAPNAPNAPGGGGAGAAAGTPGAAASTPEVAATTTTPNAPALINKPATWATPAVVDQPAGQYFAGGPGGTQMVVGQNYVATYGTPDKRGMIPWSSRLYDQSGVPVDLQDGTAVSPEDAQREIARGLADAYAKQYGGVPEGETLPTAPPAPEPAARTATIRKAAALAAAQSPSVNPVTGMRDFTEPTPLTDQPVSTPYKSIADVREHLAGVEQFTSRPNTIQWDTAMLSPGGGLFAARTSDRKGYTIFTSENGAYIRMPEAALSNKDARDVMQALERGTGPSGSTIDWSRAGTDPMGMVKDSGLSPTELGAFGVANVVAQRVANGDTTNPLVQTTAYQLNFSRSSDMAKVFPNYASGDRALTTRIGNLGLLLHDGKPQRGRYATEDRTPEQLADDAETMRVANGARNVYMLGAPDKAIAMLERRADELSARYGGGARTGDTEQLVNGDAPSRGSLHLRGIANEIRHSYSTTPVGTAALFEAQPGQRFMMYDTSPVSGNPTSTTPYARVFKILGTAEGQTYGGGRNSMGLTSSAKTRPASAGLFQIRAVEEGAPAQTPVTLSVTGDRVTMPKWVESSPGKWSPMADAYSGNPVSHAIAPLAQGQDVPDTAQKAKALTEATPTDAALESAVTKARAALDAQLGAPNATPPKQRSGAATRRVKAPSARAAKAASITPEATTPEAQRALDNQTQVIDAVAGGQLNLLDAPAQSQFNSIDDVREAWRKGNIPDSLKQDAYQQHQNYLNEMITDDSRWKGARLSAGGWFFTTPDGSLTHAPSGKRIGSFATQDVADRAGRYYETAVNPGTGSAIDWSGDGSGAVQEIRDTKEQLGIGLAGVVVNRAKLDEAIAQGPGATRALLADTPNAAQADVPSDVRVVSLNTAPYTEATGLDSPGLALSRGDFVNRTDEKNANQLRSIAAWATTMAPTHPYTVASTLADLAEKHKGTTISYRVKDPNSTDNYYPSKLTKTGDMGAALKAMSDQVMHDADPQNWSNVERLASAGNTGEAKISKVDVTPARLTSDSDRQYEQRVAFAKKLADEARSGGVQISKSVDSGNGWTLTFPGVSIPGHNDGPLQLKKTYQSTDSVSVNPDGSITATFRAVDDNSTTGTDTVYTLEIPADGWSLQAAKPAAPTGQ